MKKLSLLLAFVVCLLWAPPAYSIGEGHWECLWGSDCTITGALPACSSGEVMESDGAGGWACTDAVPAVEDISITAGENELLETDSDGNWQVSSVRPRKDYTADEDLVVYWPLAADCEDDGTGAYNVDLASVGTPDFQNAAAHGVAQPDGAPSSLNFMYGDEDEGCQIADGVNNENDLDLLWPQNHTIILWLYRTVATTLTGNARAFASAKYTDVTDGPSLTMHSQTTLTAPRWGYDGHITGTTAEAYSNTDVGEWHQYVTRWGPAGDTAMDYTATEIEIYLDGVQGCVGGCTTQGAIGANTWPTRLGVIDGATKAVSGYMSSVMIFDRLLSEREICEIYAYGPDGTWTNGEAACLADDEPRIVGIGAYPPSTCNPGEVWVDTDETVDTNCATAADNSMCLCSTADTWVEAGGPDPQETVFFCGELGANTDEFFGGPNLVSVFTGDVPTDHTFASGTCDALGDTAVAGVDNDLDEFQGYRVDGMFCQVSAAPGAAATVITFVDDTVNTPVTCSVAAAETSCASARGLGANVAANSQVAISTLNGTDDESAQDFHCNVYITWE